MHVSFPLIASFHIFCQQEVNWIYNDAPISQQYVILQLCDFEY